MKNLIEFKKVIENEIAIREKSLIKLKDLLIRRNCSFYQDSSYSMLQTKINTYTHVLKMLEAEIKYLEEKSHTV